MHIAIEHTSTGKTFGIAFYKKEGDKAPFFVSKGNRIMQKKDGGEFVSGPSVKMDDGKYLNYTFMANEFGDHILKLYKESKPAQKQEKPIEDDEAPF